MNDIKVLEEKFKLTEEEKEFINNFYACSGNHNMMNGTRIISEFYSAKMLENQLIK